MSDQLRRQLQDRLEEIQNRFISLLGDISDADFEHRWGDETWTIKEEFVHIVQVIQIIPNGIEQAIRSRKKSILGFVPSNIRSWVNGHVIIPQKAKNATRESIIEGYQNAHQSMVEILYEIKESDWGKGIPYPRIYRSVKQLAYRPIEHFEEHEIHILELLEKEKG